MVQPIENPVESERENTMPRNMAGDTKATFRQAADELDADILLLNSAMLPDADERVRSAVSGRVSEKKKLVVVLVTSGGLPDVAYRIAMIVRQRYEHVSICIPGWCKSAGTLLAISANELVMGPKGEMGPLDVQIAKRDDLGGDRDSGLVINEALARLRNESFELFSEFMIRLIAQSSNVVTLRTAADIAAQLTIGLMSPIFEKIDPMRMGADARAMNIGEEYAVRLNALGQNLRGSDALSMLLNGYPSHSFVIDINEASNLFTRVQRLEGMLAAGIEQLGPLALLPKPDSGLICYLEGDDGGKSNQQQNGPSEEPPDAADAGVGGALGDVELAEELRRDHEESLGQARSRSAT